MNRLPCGVSVPYKGSVLDVIAQLIGGVRSSMGYTGCATLDDMRTKTKPVRVTGKLVLEISRMPPSAISGNRVA